MSTHQSPHPARSPEFLSRLHDQELSPGERAHFEAHRAHCAECRTAAAEFEQAIALFRASSPRPASPDLAARILRKLQSADTRRHRFGVTFGIDLRWAGAFAAALVAAIVGSAIVVRNEARVQPSAVSRAPIPVIVEPEREKLPSEKNAPPPAAAVAPETKRDRSLSAKDEETRASASRGADKKTASAAAPAAPASHANAFETDRQDAADAAAAPERAQVGAKAEKPAPPAAMARSAPAYPADGVVAQSPAVREPERAGGEGGAAAVAEESAAKPIRLVVSPLDDAGTPPDVIAASAADLPAALRGQEFVVIVDAAGRVREVVPRRAELRDSRRAKERQLAKQAPASPLAAVRFQPGDRQRRLLVRVE